MRAWLYLRQSLGRDDETSDTSLSLDAQEATLRAWLDKQGHAVVGSTRDHDLRGNDPNRPGVREVMAVAADKRADAIAVLAMSRFAREHVWQEIAYRQIKAYGLSILSQSEPNLDHTLFRGVLGVVNQYASEQTGQFLKAAFAEMATRGLYHGSAPFGWTNCGKGIIAPHPEQAPIVAELAHRFLVGDRWFALARWLLSQGIQSPRGSAIWHDAVIRRTLLNPCHAGYVRTRNGLIPGRHADQAIISPDEWCRIRQLVEARPTVRHKSIEHWAEGLVVHACGRRMYLWPTRQNGVTYLSYVCGSQRKPERCDIGTPSLSTRILDRLARLALASDLAGVLDVAGAVARAEAVAGSASIARERAALEREQKTLNNRRDAIITLFELGKITLGEYDSRIAAVERLSETNQEKHASLPAPVDAEMVARTIVRVAAARDALRLDLIPDERMREVVEPLGKIVVSPSGVGLVYVPEVAGVLEREPVMVPKSRYLAG